MIRTPPVSEKGNKPFFQRLSRKIRVRSISSLLIILTVLPVIVILANQPQDLRQHAAGESIDTLSYFLTHHPDQVLTGTHSLSQEMSGTNIYMVKSSADSFEAYRYDANYIYLVEDHSNAPLSPYSFTDGQWMKRTMQVGESFTMPEDNLIQNFDNACTKISSQPNVLASGTPFRAIMTLEQYLPTFAAGGDIGTQDVIVLKYSFTGGNFERFYYSHDWGWVRWESYARNQLIQTSVFNKIAKGVPTTPHCAAACTTSLQSCPSTVMPTPTQLPGTTPTPTPTGTITQATGQITCSPTTLNLLLGESANASFSATWIGADIATGSATTQVCKQGTGMPLTFVTEGHAAQASLSGIITNLVAPHNYVLMLYDEHGLSHNTNPSADCTGAYVASCTIQAYTASSSAGTPTVTPKPTITPTSPPTPTPTPLPSATIIVTAFLHGIGKAGDLANPLAVGNDDPLTKSRRFTLEAFEGGTPVGTGSGLLTYDAVAGNYQGSIMLSPPTQVGRYTLALKTPSFLKARSASEFDITAGQPVTIFPLSLVAGDAVEDNTLDILDYNALLSCYNTEFPGCTEHLKTTADLDNNGKVDLHDINLFLREIRNLPTR